MTSLVSMDVRDGVAWIALDRAGKRNAINDALLNDLEARVAEAQSAARAMVIHGNGPCFSAGLDLGEHRAREPAEVFWHSRGWHRVFRAIRTGRVPAVAAIHGACVGGGLELAAACHIRVADETAFFALPEGTRGIFVGGGASVHVSRPLDAAAAERAGLITYLMPPGDHVIKAGEIAAKVAAMAPLTVLGVLGALPRIAGMAEEDGLFVESMMAALAQTGPEAAARLAAFVEKRAPKAGEN